MSTTTRPETEQELRQKYAAAVEKGDTRTAVKLDAAIFKLDPANQEIIQSIKDTIDMAGPSQTRKGYDKSDQLNEHLLRALDIAIVEWEQETIHRLIDIYEADPTSAVEKIEQLVQSENHPDDRRVLSRLARRADSIAMRRLRGPIFAAKHRVGSVVLRAIQRQAPVANMPFWKVVVWSLWGRAPMPTVSWLDKRDTKTTEHWYPVIDALGSDCSLHPISLNGGRPITPHSDGPRAFLGGARFGAVVLAGRTLPLLERSTVGLILYDREGHEVVRFGEAVSMAPRVKEAKTLKGLHMAGIFKDWDFPIAFTNNDQGLKERIDRVCQTLDDRGEIQTLGLD